MTAASAKGTPWEGQDPTRTVVDLSVIDESDVTQLRAGGTSTVLAEEYAGLLRDDAVDFPAVVLFHEEEVDTYWIGDGCHRVLAHRLAGRRSIAAKVYVGDVTAAVLWASGANASHGKRRSKADLRHVLRTLLLHPVWGDRSNAWIARRARCAQTTVANHLQRLIADGERGPRGDSVTVRRNGVEYQMKTPAPEPEPQPEPERPAEPLEPDDDSDTLDYRWCPHCAGSHPLADDGRMAQHLHGDDMCAGTGTLPAPVELDTDEIPRSIALGGILPEHVRQAMLTQAAIVLERWEERVLEQWGGRVIVLSVSTRNDTAHVLELEPELYEDSAPPEAAGVWLDTHVINPTTSERWRVSAVHPAVPLWPPLEHSDVHDQVDDEHADVRDLDNAGDEDLVDDAGDEDTRHVLSGSVRSVPALDADDLDTLIRGSILRVAAGTVWVDPPLVRWEGPHRVLRLERKPIDEGLPSPLKVRGQLCGTFIDEVDGGRKVARWRVVGEALEPCRYTGVAEDDVAAEVEPAAVEEAEAPPAPCPSRHPVNDRACEHPEGHGGPHDYRDERVPEVCGVARRVWWTDDGRHRHPDDVLVELEDLRARLADVLPKTPPTERRKNDAYYTPQAAADACLRYLVAHRYVTEHDTVWEPHVGGGAWVRAFASLDPEDHDIPAGIVVSDIDPEAPALGWAPLQDVAHQVGDFLALDHTVWERRPTVILGNPPYRDAEAQVVRALELVAPFSDVVRSSGTVAFLLPVGFLFSAERAAFWEKNPADRIVALAQRPSFIGDADTGVGQVASQDYALFIWRVATWASSARRVMGIERLEWR